MINLYVSAGRRVQEKTHLTEAERTVAGQVTDAAIECQAVNTQNDGYCRHTATEHWQCHMPHSADEHDAGEYQLAGDFQ